MEPEIEECPKCRAEVFQGAFFCMQCGTRLEKRGAMPSSMRVKAQPQQPEKARTASDTGYSVTTTTRRANER